MDRVRMGGGRALDGRGLRDRDARSGADGKRACQYQDDTMPCSPVSASTPACQRARYGQGQGASVGRWPPLTFAARAGRPVAERDEGMRRLFREQKDDDLGADGGPDARGRHSSSSTFRGCFQSSVQTDGSSLDWNSLARIGNGKIGPSNLTDTK